MSTLASWWFNISVQDEETNTVLGLVDAYYIPVYFAEGSQIGNIAMSIPDDATDHLLGIHTSISATTNSIHDLRTGSAYQVITTGNIKLVLRITANASNTTFKIWKSTSADSASGTTVYDFTGTDLDASNLITTLVLTFAVTANDYINVETPTTNDINAVRAWIVEYPTP